MERDERGRVVTGAHLSPATEFPPGAPGNPDGNRSAGAMVTTVAESEHG